MSILPVSKYVNSYRVRLDSRRRPTLPVALLEEAEIDGEGTDLIARVEGPGRVVLEDPTALLHDLQERVAQGMARRGDTRDLALELIDERQRDESLR